MSYVVSALLADEPPATASKAAISMAKTPKYRFMSLPLVCDTDLARMSERPDANRIRSNIRPQGKGYRLSSSLGFAIAR
jgi:hypothetical protein